MIRMKKIVYLFLKLFIIAGLLLFTIEPTQAVDNAKRNVLVGFHQSPDSVQVQQLSGEVYREFNLIDAVAVRLPSTAIRSLEKNPAVKYVEPDEKVLALGTSIASAPQTIPWGIDRIFGEEEYPFPTWDDSIGTGIAVAVMDTGIDKNHQSLPQLAGGVNFADDTHWGWDGSGHGTHVAGIIAAQTSEVPGISPGIDLYSIKVLDETGSGQISDLIAGIEWAVQEKIPLINLSLGLNANLMSLQDACQAAFREGHLLIAAAGNEGENTGGDNVMYPAAYPSVVAVSASDSSDGLGNFSSSGSEVELIAPGDEIKSTVPPLPVTDTIHVGKEQYKAQTLVGSGVGTITGPLVDCGLAMNDDSFADFPEGDWIALIDRGEITFADKVRNVMEKGAAAAIIVNNDEDNPDDKGAFTLYATEEDKEHDWVPTVSVSLNSGQAIREGELKDGKVSVECGGLYRYNKGTSMAAPHVTGASALAWSASQELTQKEIRKILQDSAEDLGLASEQQGYGLIRADQAVAKALSDTPISTDTVKGSVIYEAEEAGVSRDVVVKIEANGTQETITIDSGHTSENYKLRGLEPDSYDISAQVIGDAKENYEIITDTYDNVKVEADVTVKGKDFILSPFVSEEYTLSIDAEGKGNVLVEGESVDLPFINDYEKGAEVELTANPAEGWRFEKWQINEKERLTLNTELKMEEDKTVMAYFEKIEDEKEWILLPSPEEDIALDKSWQVTFNRPFSQDEIDGMVIERENKFISVDIKLLPEEGQAIVTPVEDYLPGKEYNLRIFLNNLNRYKMYFTTEEEESV